MLAHMKLLMANLQRNKMSETRFRLSDLNEDIDQSLFDIEVDEDGYVTKMEIKQPVKIDD